MSYVVKSDVITGIKGKKYYKGETVKVEFFHPEHALQLEKLGYLSKVNSKKVDLKDKS